MQRLHRKQQCTYLQPVRHSKQLFDCLLHVVENLYRQAWSYFRNFDVKFQESASQTLSERSTVVLYLNLFRAAHSCSSSDGWCNIRWTFESKDCLMLASWTILVRIACFINYRRRPKTFKQETSSSMNSSTAVYCVTILIRCFINQLKSLRRKRARKHLF